MKLLTSRGYAKTAAKRWKKHYCTEDDFGNKVWCIYRMEGDKTKEQIYKELKALGKEPNPDDVDAIIGNDTWTRFYCYECQKERVDAVVQVGEDPPHQESATVQLCLDCCKKAYNLIGEESW